MQLQILTANILAAVFALLAAGAAADAILSFAGVFRAFRREAHPSFSFTVLSPFSLLHVL